MISPADVLRRDPLLPQAREAEMGLLGAMIYDNEVIGDVLDVVGREMFAFPAHQVIFDSVLRLHLAGKPLDLLVLHGDLARDRRLEAVGGAEYLATLVETTPNSANALFYAETVRDKFIVRNIMQTCAGILRRATQGPEDVGHFQELVRRALEDLQTGAVRGPGGSPSLADTLDTDLLELRQPRTGVPTGFPTLDMLTGGVRDLWSVTGPPTVGKSTFVEQVALEAAERGHPVLFVSLEMARRMVLARALVARSPRAGTVEAILKSELLLREALDAVHDLLPKLYVRDPADLPTLPAIESEVRRLSRLHGEPPLTVIDHAQLVDLGAAQRNLDSFAREQEIQRRVLALSIGSGSPILLVGEQNKDGLNATSLRASKGAVENIYNPAVIITLTDAALGDEPELVPGERVVAVPAETRPIRLNVIKARNGVGRFFLEVTFDPAKYTMREAHGGPRA